MIVGLKYARESLVQKGETTQRGKEKTCTYVFLLFFLSFFFSLSFSLVCTRLFERQRAALCSGLTVKDVCIYNTFINMYVLSYKHIVSDIYIYIHFICLAIIILWMGYNQYRFPGFALTTHLYSHAIRLENVRENYLEGF